MVKDLSGLRILLVEDDFLIAMDMKESIEGMGGEVIGPVGRLKQAQELARRETFDGAILDVRLDGDLIYPLAEELTARGVPVVLATGYEPGSLPEKFKDLPHVRKPVHTNEIRLIATRFFRQR